MPAVKGGHSPSRQRQSEPKGAVPPPRPAEWEQQAKKESPPPTLHIHPEPQPAPVPRRKSLAGARSGGTGRRKGRSHPAGTSGLDRYFRAKDFATGLLLGERGSFRRKLEMERGSGQDRSRRRIIIVLVSPAHPGLESVWTYLFSLEPVATIICHPALSSGDYLIACSVTCR